MSTDSKVLIVEFLGTPGGGKTTLMETARDTIQQGGFRAYSVVEAARPFARRTIAGKLVNHLSPPSYRNQLLWQVFYYISLAHRLIFRRKHGQLVKFVESSQKRRPAEAAIRERRVLFWFRHLIGYYDFLTTHGQQGEVIIFDDGFIHRVVHLHASTVETPDPASIRAYVDQIPQPDIVIVPRVPLEVCEQRVLRRGIWDHFRDKSREELRQYLLHSQQAVNVTVDYIKAKGWKVIEVDNGSDDPTFTNKDLQNKLMSTAPFDRTPSGDLRETPVPWIPNLPRPSRLSEFVKSRLRSLDIESEIVESVLDQYGLELVEPPSNLPLSRRTRNLMLNTPAGKKVLKRYRARLAVPTIVYSHSILERLVQIDFPTLRLSATPAGQTYVSLESGNYAIFDFVDGKNYSLSFVPPSYRHILMRHAGQTLGRLHAALAGFMPEGWHHLGFVSYEGDWRRNMAWHSAKVEEMKEKSNSLSNEEERLHAKWLVQNCNYILDELGQLDETLRGSALPRLIIHGDYGLHNIVFARSGVVTPIDFESSRLEWRLTDVVSALSRLRYRNGVYNFESIRNFLQGYQSANPISAEEWEFLPLVWRFHKLRASLIYWNSYFETGGPARKLISARDAVSQADWAIKHPDQLLRLNSLAMSH